MNNIAEGFERRTPKDFAHFLDQAKGSCGEVRSMLYVAEDLKYLPVTSANAMRQKAETLSRGIAAFTKPYADPSHIPTFPLPIKKCSLNRIKGLPERLHFGYERPLNP